MRPLQTLAIVSLLYACQAMACSSDSSHYATDYSAPESLEAASAWAGFRGPKGSGVATDANVPVTWSASENMIWKADLPGYGTSSPVVAGEKLFLTCYSGYGQGLESGSIDSLMRHVVCIDRGTGDILWNKSLQPEGDDESYSGFLALHGYASSTPVTDGQNVFVFFGSSGLYAFDLAGEQLWHASAGDGTHDWGSAASPVLYGDLVIVNAAVESGALVAFDKSSGTEAWRLDGLSRTWGTPVICEVDGRHELVLSMEGEIIGVDPASGRKLWDTEGVHDYICSSVVVHDGVVYAIGARKGEAVAVRAGDVTGDREVWRKGVGSNVTSPVYMAGRLHWVTDQGIVYCLDAKTGDEIYRDRLASSGRVYASVIAVGDKLYAVSREAGTFVIAGGGEFKQLAHNELADTSVFNASPIVFADRLYLRSDRALYCLGTATGKAAQDGATPAAANAMRSVILADARLSAIRNEATRNVSLDQAIADYLNGLAQLDLKGAPEDFLTALDAHRDAWRKIEAYLGDFSDARGEMHAAFDEVRKDSNPTRDEFIKLEKALFETWAVLEDVLKKHGVETT